MEAQEGPAAPESGNSDAPEHDPEIEALLDFEPVPRKMEVEGGWTPEAQRDFIARLAVCGSANKACEEMGRNRTGVTKLYRSPLGASFRAAWDGAVELAKQRRALLATTAFVAPGTVAPTLDNRCKWPTAPPGPLPEDVESILLRAEQARGKIVAKLLNARRLYLKEISSCPGKRAAFEILTELPIDWEKAERLEPQPDEPWRRPNMRQPDMLLTAENGWLGEIGGSFADKKAELMRVIDEFRVKKGLEPVDWDS